VVSRFAVSGLRRVVRTVLPVIGAGLLLGGCGSSQIAASTTCKDYLAQSEESRHDAAVRISSETRGLSDPGNPMWGLSLDAACGSDPNMTVGQYFARGSGAPTQSGTSSQSGASSHGSSPQSTRLTSDANCADWNAATIEQRGNYAAHAVGEPAQGNGHYEITSGKAQDFLHSWLDTGCKEAARSGDAITKTLADIATPEQAHKVADGEQP
jgi:hypothetical protein